MISQKGIVGVMLFVIIIVGVGYVWFTDIQPDLDRISKINEKTRESNEKIQQERVASYDLDKQSPNCWYDKVQKVRICD